MNSIFELLGNYFFPMCLSVYLIFRIDHFMTELVKNQKEFSRIIIGEIKDIKKDILEIRLDMAKSSCKPLL